MSRTGYLAIAVCVCASAGTAVADGPSAAPNQSLVIEAPPKADGTTAAPAPPDSTTPRTIRRKAGSSALTDALGSTESVPWYRTSAGALGIVLALVVGSFLLLRRWAPAARAPDSSMLKVLGRAGLTPKHSLALVQFGRRIVLVGISPDRVNAISEIADANEAAELSGVGAPGSTTGNAFDEALGREAAEYLGTGDATDGQRRTRAASPAPLKDLLGRLKSMQK